MPKQKILNRPPKVVLRCTVCDSVLKKVNENTQYCKDCRDLAKSFLSGKKQLIGFKKSGVFLTDEDRFRAEVLLAKKAGVSYGFLQHWKKQHILEYRNWLRTLEIHYSKNCVAIIVVKNLPVDFPTICHLPPKNEWGTAKVVIHDGKRNL